MAHTCESRTMPSKCPIYRMPDMTGIPDAYTFSFKLKNRQRVGFAHTLL